MQPNDCDKPIRIYTKKYCKNLISAVETKTGNFNGKSIGYVNMELYLGDDKNPIVFHCWNTKFLNEKANLAETSDELRELAFQASDEKADIV